MILLATDDFGRYAGDGHIRWYVFKHHTTCSDFGVSSYFYVADNFATGRKKYALTYFRMAITAGFAGAAQGH